MPNLHIKELSEEELAAQRVIAAQPKPITSTMIEEVRACVPHIDQDIIKKVLEDLRGDIHGAVNKLLDAEDSSSTSSQSGSSATSFTERDPDSEDEEPRGPNKRRNRRSMEKSEPTKQYVPSHLSTSVTAEPSESIEASSDQAVLLPMRAHKPQRLRLRLNKNPLKDVGESWREPVSDSDGDFVPETFEDDDENDAASEYSSGTSRSVSSARPSPSRSRSVSKGIASRKQKPIRSQSKQTLKLRQRSTIPTASDIGSFASESTPTNLDGSPIKAKAIKT